MFSYSDCEWFSAPMMTQSRSKLKTCPSRMSWVSLMSMGSSDMIFPLKVKSPSKGLNTLFFSSVNAPACNQTQPKMRDLDLDFKQTASAPAWAREWFVRGLRLSEHRGLDTKWWLEVPSLVVSLWEPNSQEDFATIKKIISTTNQTKKRLKAKR